MPFNYNEKIRLQQELQEIIGNDKKRRQITKSYLAEKLEVSEKTIQRDLRRLEELYDIELDFDREHNTLCIKGELRSTKEIYFNPNDLFLLFFGAMVAEQYRDTPLFDDLHNAMKRLSETLNTGDIPVSLYKIQQAFSVKPVPPRMIDSGTFKDVLNALNHSKVLKISYHRPGRKPETREIHPYHLISHSGESYLLAWCTSRKAARIFALSRIGQLELLERKFERNPEVDVDGWLRNSFGIFYSGKEVKEQQVKLRFSKAQAPYILEREWFPGQKTVAGKDGSLELLFKVKHLYEATRWILSWGKDVCVLEPAELREAVKEELRQTLGNY